MISPGIIDFHVHLFPDRLFEAIWDFFLKSYGWDLKYKIYHRECVDLLKNAGVETIVYSNYAHRPGIAADINRWNHRVLEEDDDLFCFAAYHPDDPDAMDYARETLSHPRVLGFKLHFLVQRFAPDDERLFPLYDLVMDKNKRLLFHVGTGPIGNEFVGLERFSVLLSLFPGLPVNIAHLGALEYEGFFGLLDNNPNIMMDTAFTFIPNLPGGYDLGVETLERYRNRLLYGSDFPFLIFSRDLEIGAINDLGLSDECLSAIFRDNANQLLLPYKTI